MTQQDVAQRVLALAQEIGGVRNASLSDRVYANLGISGGDAVEFYDKLEADFSVDIRPVTETVVDVPRRWFRKARRARVARDPTLLEISSFIQTALANDRSERVND